MNKSESKYFNTALRMDEALIALLETKDLEYVTVKEVCEKAGVNRSTFYLHYETISDLLNETLEMINERFLEYFPQHEKNMFDRAADRKLEDFVLITKEYLIPYLQFIKDNKKVYRAVFRNPNSMQAYVRYVNLKKYVLNPILAKFEVPVSYRQYFIAYYIEGIIAIIKEWLRQDCTDDVGMIATVIEECVRPESEKYGQQQ